MKKILCALIFFNLISCNPKVDCQSFEVERRKEECNLIVEITPTPSSVYFKAKGKNLDGKECECNEESRWWATFSNNIEKGDTIIKKKGELTFSIHKKDTMLIYNWECEGKKYK
jgi:hypothetical protein